MHGGAELAMNLFFESAAMILALVTLGKFLEAKSKGKTRSEVDKLLRLRPQTATVLRDGAPVQVSVDDIAVGDTVVVLSGEYVPCDGVITVGSTSRRLRASPYPRKRLSGRTSLPPCSTLRAG